jgi:hypothetical protein
MSNQLNIDKLINYLELESTLFNMCQWFDRPNEADWNELAVFEPEVTPVCGTAACIGGACDLLRFRSEDGLTFNINGHEYDYDTPYAAAQWLLEGLGRPRPLPDQVSAFLFAPGLPHANYLSDPYEKGFITKAQALKTLRHLRDTGEIEWFLP